MYRMAGERAALAERALYWLQTAVDFDPHRAEPYLMLGQLYLQVAVVVVVSPASCSAGSTSRSPVLPRAYFRPLPSVTYRCLPLSTVVCRCLPSCSASSTSRSYVPAYRVHEECTFPH